RASPVLAAIADGSVAGVEVGAGAFAGGGTSWNDDGSIPTLLETIAGWPAVVAGVPSLNDVGSTPTELETTGGVGVVGVAEAEAAEAAGSGGVMSRLSFTTGTRTVLVVWCSFNGCAGATAWAACRCAAAGALATTGGA